MVMFKILRNRDVLNNIFYEVILVIYIRKIIFYFFIVIIEIGRNLKL